MSDRATRAPAHAADIDEVRDARYANPFAPPDETEAAAETRPRSLFGEILDWMLAPLLLLWPMSLAVTYLVAKSIAKKKATAAYKKQSKTANKETPKEPSDLDSLDHAAKSRKVNTSALASMIATTLPSDTSSPTFTFTSFTVPAIVDGPSIVALSDSNVTNP